MVKKVPSDFGKSNQDVINTSLINISLTMGDITDCKVDAILVPEFNDCASYGGVGGAVARTLGEQGLEAFDEYIDQHGKQEFGTVLLTPSNGSHKPSLLHVVSVGSSSEEEFSTVKTAFANALKVAEQNNIKSIAAPILGTGIIGSLTPKQSAEAMLSALKEYSEEGGKAMDVNFVVYRDDSAYAAFQSVLSSASYATASSTQAGQKEFDLHRWDEKMREDLAANARHFGNVFGPKPKK